MLGLSSLLSEKNESNNSSWLTQYPLWKITKEDPCRLHAFEYSSATHLHKLSFAAWVVVRFGTKPAGFLPTSVSDKPLTRDGEGAEMTVVTDD